MKNLTKKVLTFAFIIATAILSTNASASDKITIVHYYKAGGGADSATNVLIESLQQTGYQNIEVKYFKSCDKALSFVSTNLNSYMVGGNENYDFSDNSKCKYNQYTNVKPISAIYKAGLYVCTAVGKTFTLDNLLAREAELSVATVSGDGSLWLSKWIKDNNLSLKIINYDGSKSTTAAALAGDVDLVLAGSKYQKLLEKGATCFLSSETINKLSLPSMGAKPLKSLGYIPYGFEAMLFSEHRNAGFEQALKKAVNQENFINFMQKNGFTFNGINNTRTVEQFNAYIENYVTEISKLRNLK